MKRFFLVLLMGWSLSSCEYGSAHRGYVISQFDEKGIPQEEPSQ